MILYMRAKPFDMSLFTNNDCDTAYWMGLLMADGSLEQPCKNSYRLRLAIKEEDSQIVTDFAKALGNPDLAVTGDAGQRQVRISSHHLLDVLSPWGIVPRKTREGSGPPSDMPMDLRSHYVRGLSDGDGCIHCSKSIQWILSGNKITMDWVQTTLETTLGDLRIARKTMPRNERNGYECHLLKVCHQKQITKALRWMYADAGPRLERKALLATEAIAEADKRYQLRSAPRTCFVCGNEFSPKHWKQVHCGIDCRRKNAAKLAREKYSLLC